MLNYHSYYRHLAGQSMDWVITDTQELYENNLINRRGLLERNGWIGSKFTYDFNSLGFRCEEFSTDPTIMFLGCSFTMGIGLPIEMTWTHLVSQHLGLRCANLGQAGGSSDTAFRLCHGYIDKIRPKAVVFMRPDLYRFELTNDRYSENYSSHNHSQTEFYRLLVEFEQTPIFLREKNTLAIEHLCQQREIKFIMCEYQDLYDIGTAQDFRLDMARDLLHPGQKRNQLMSKRVLDLIESTANG